MYGVELDSITGRIAQKLYPNAEIKVAGFETTDRREMCIRDRPDTINTMNEEETQNEI